jgi:ribosome-binding ATPase YchF (GTP1/OBG family)
VDALPDFAKKMIEELRKENASHRKAKQAAQEAATKAEEARLEEERNFQELAEQRKAKIEELEAQAAQVADLTGLLNARIKAEIKEWPEEIRAMAPQDEDPRILQSWVDQARPLAEKLQQAGQTPGNGTGPKPAGTSTRTDQEARQAWAQTFRAIKP